MIEITDKQREQWINKGKCHVCGSGVDKHTHPQWMWLANPPPGNSERAKIERKMNKEILKKII